MSCAFKLMQSGNMDGLFQVEGALYVSLFKRLPPKRSPTSSLPSR